MNQLYKYLCISFCAFYISIDTFYGNETMPINVVDTIYKNKSEPIASQCYDFYPYEENGLWGIKRQEEIVMTPGFEKLSGEYNSEGIFAYKENGKWGIVSIYDILTPPIYDSIQIMKMDYSYSYAKFKVHDKFGIMTIVGDTIFQPIYEDISYPFRQYLYGEERHDFFLVKELGEPYKIIICGGICVLEGIDFSKNNMFEFSKDVLNKIKSNFKKLKKQSLKNIALKKKFEDLYELERKAQYATSFSKRPNREIPSTPIVIAGFEGTINELGVIDIPLLYNQNEEILRRDPDNIFALDAIMSAPYNPNLSPFSDSSEYSEYCRQRLVNARFYIKKYSYLVQLCDAKGYQESALKKKFERILNNNYKIEKEYEEKVDRNAKVDEFNAKVDRVANNLTNAINSISMELLNSSSSNESIMSDYVNAYSSSSSFDTSAKPSSVDFKSQYLKWESLARRHYNSLTSTGYRVKEDKKNKFGGNGQSLSSGNYIRQKKALREAQAQMRNIRQQASRKGMDIPQSQYETVSVSY